MSKNFISIVREFHETFDQVILLTPQVPAEDRIKLRLGLIREETDELEDALKSRNVKDMADALADLMYVVSGTVLESGLTPEMFQALFEEVHRSNMSKACKSLDEAQKTVVWYGVPCDIREKTINGEQRWLVFRKADNKLLKSIEYSPADVNGIIQVSKV